HVVDARLELVGGELLGALHQHLGGLAGGGAADLGGLGSVRPGTAGDNVGVALDDGDLVHGDPDPLGDDLRERRLVTLALGQRAGADDRLTIGGYVHSAELGLVDPVGDLDVRAYADPELEHVAALAALCLLAAQLFVVGGLQQQ